MEENITTGSFVQLLWNAFFTQEKFSVDSKSNSSLKQLLHYGHQKGWLEDQDEIDSSAFLNKRTAARIIHQFIKIELHIPDAYDISKAEGIRDLYTCRVCANHIAQVLAQNIMSAEEVEINGQNAYMFNGVRMVLKTEAAACIETIRKLAKRNC